MEVRQQAATWQGRGVLTEARKSKVPENALHQLWPAPEKQQKKREKLLLRVQKSRWPSRALWWFVGTALGEGMLGRKCALHLAEGLITPPTSYRA